MKLNFNRKPPIHYERHIFQRYVFYMLSIHRIDIAQKYYKTTIVLWLYYNRLSVFFSSSSIQLSRASFQMLVYYFPQTLGRYFTSLFYWNLRFTIFLFEWFPFRTRHKHAPLYVAWEYSEFIYLSISHHGL